MKHEKKLLNWGINKKLFINKKCCTTLVQIFVKQSINNPKSIDYLLDFSVLWQFLV